MNNLRKKILSMMLMMSILLLLLPTNVLAAPSGVTLTVNPSSALADDSSPRADGAIYKTLQAAVNAAQNNDTIAVAQDLTLTSKVYVAEKNITLTSSDKGNPVTIYRGAGFASSVDGSRPNGYNPAMFEVAVSIISTPSDCASSLRLEHIILDEKALNEKDPSSSIEQLKKGQDGMIAVYGIVIDNTSGRIAKCILGEGAVLRNWGGDSAILATAYGRVEMESGSVIEDTMAATNWTSGHGQAIALAAGYLDMQKGAVIQNLVASAHGVFVDGGTAIINGTIKGLRGTSSTNGSGNAIRTNGSDTLVTIGADGLITDNYSWRGAVDLWGANLKLTVYGTVDDNHSTDRGGGISTSDYSGGTITLMPGCKVTNNTSQETGGGLYISPSGMLLVMEGGEISGNRSGVNQDGSINAGQMGGGIAFRKYGDAIKLLLKGGVIKDNIATGIGGGIGLDGGCGIEKIIPENGSTIVIKDNLQNTSESNDIGMTAGVAGSEKNQHLQITTETTLGNKWIYLGSANKYVSLKDETSDLSLANVNGTLETRFSTEAAALSLKKLAALWVNTPSDILSFDITKPTDSVDGLPFYVLTMQTKEDGTVDTAVKPEVYLASVNSDGSLKVAFTNNNANGYAVAIAQPITDYGTFVITGPAELDQKTDGTDYEVAYSSSFTATKDMLDIITARGTNGTYQFTIQLDNRLTLKKNGSNVDFTLTSEVFAVDPNTVVVDGSKVTFTCTLKTGWENKLTSTAPLFKADLTGVLPNANFEAGKYLNTTGKVTFSMANTNDIIIPANLVQTLMKEKTTTGNLTVSKTVSGSGAETTKDFTFTVTLTKTGSTFNQTYGEMNFVNGEATFTLKAGQQKKATGIPAGTEYTVKESDNSGYTVTVNGTKDTTAKGTIIADQDEVAAFNNERTSSITPPNTGDHHNSLWFYTLGLMSLAGIAIIVSLKSKKTVK